MRTVFFVPVFNQARELPRVLAELAAAALPDAHLLLVNNGSSDGSERLVRESGHPFLDLPRNQGVGGANALALDWALERGVEIFGNMAANGKMLPAEIPRLLEPILAGRADYVTGSRFLPGGGSPNLPPFRRRSIPLVNLFVRGLTGAALTDATCGFRAFRLEILRRATFDWHAPSLATYGLEYYLYAKVLLDGRLRWTERPVTMRYPEAGPYTKIRAGRDWYAMLRPWLAARLDGQGFR
ncbi:MAG: dolichol-phosphate mannosyltransferase [Acidobacteriota bacterium]|jgi:glycosyltransferase involved in cell wall biosynthesis|nr:dolichol-phosphate mannosyltransferase [Acidobacteriota bacterium]